MSQIKRAIQEKILKPHDNNQFDTVLAEVVAYDGLKHRATISFKDPKYGGFLTSENVPIQLGSGGFHSAGPFVGDQVWVSFANKSLLQPKIVALADERYQIHSRKRLQHQKQGAYLPDNLVEANGAEEYDFSAFAPLHEDWIDLSNQNTNKYADWTVDPIQTLLSAMTNTSFYEAEEPGITHPKTGSTVKLRNNGMIDIFVEGDQGIRIDPKTQSINFFTRNENHHVTNLNATVDDSMKLAIQKHFGVEAETFALKTGEATMEVGKWSVSSEGDVHVKSGKNITLEANNRILLRGSQVLLDGEFITNRDDIIKILNGEEVEEDV